MSKKVNETDKIQAAGLGKRIVAYLLDSLILGVVGSIPVVIIMLATGIEEMTVALMNPEYAKVYVPYKIMMLVVPVVEFLYFFLQESSGFEATLGKRALSLKVVYEDGVRGRTLDMMVRSIIRVLPYLVGITFGGVIGTICSIVAFVVMFIPLFNKRHRALHDFVAGTVVADAVTVEEKRNAAAVPEINVKLPSVEEIKSSSDNVKTSAPMAKTRKILCTSGLYKGATLPLDAPIIIGRDRKFCNLIYENDTKGVSKVHCRVEVTGAGVTLVDLGSTYGTTVNGNQIVANEKVRLNVGDRFHFGKYEEFVVQ
ncbi:MAG: RDD family protein [Lachnospiraceae bacterium]|nr:RDD family protein [Lachnospiraceae bacterium]